MAEYSESKAEAVVIVNDLKFQMSGLATALVTALEDGKVSPWEALMLGPKALALASSIMVLLQGVSKETRKDVLYVLQHGVVVLPTEVGSA